VLYLLFKEERMLYFVFELLVQGGEDFLCLVFVIQGGEDFVFCI